MLHVLPFHYGPVIRYQECPVAFRSALEINQQEYNKLKSVVRTLKNDNETD